jgi:hypothetical protein
MGGFILLGEGEYISLLESIPPQPKNPMRRKVWSSIGLPKNNIFSWTMAHGKILTTKNLKKRGIPSPSWCVMCSA